CKRPFADLGELRLERVPVVQDAHRGCRSEELLGPLLDARGSQDLLKPVLIDFPLEPAAQLLEARHAVGDTGRGPTFGLVDRPKEIRKPSEASDLLQAC